MRRGAYTILELVLVLAVMVILAALTYPSLSSMYGQYKVTGSCDTVKAAMVTARGQAIEDGVPYRFAYVPGKGNYRVAPDLPNFWTGGPPPNQNSNGDSNTGKLLILEGSLPSGIAFPDGDSAIISEEDSDTSLELDAVSPSQWKAIAVFLPDGSARMADGTPRDVVSIPLGARNSATMVVRLRCLTATVTVRRMNAEGNN
jgi:Tfp pilus assembly protein FimT